MEILCGAVMCEECMGVWCVCCVLANHAMHSAQDREAVDIPARWVGQEEREGQGCVHLLTLHL